MKYKKLLAFLMIALLIPINVSAKTLGDLKKECTDLENAYNAKQSEINNNEQEQRNTNAKNSRIKN